MQKWKFCYINNLIHITQCNFLSFFLHDETITRYVHVEREQFQTKIRSIKRRLPTIIRQPTNYWFKVPDFKQKINRHLHDFKHVSLLCQMTCTTISYRSYMYKDHLYRKYCLSLVCTKIIYIGNIAIVFLYIGPLPQSHNHV